MFDRLSRVALAMTIALPAIAAAQGFEYAVGTSQYKVTQVTKITQEAMGQKQDMETSFNQVFTSTIQKPSKDTLLVTSIIDSIAVVGPMGPMMGMDKLVGLAVKAKVSPMGVKYSAEGPSDDSLPGAGQQVDALSTLLPKIRGAMKSGSSWVDTTSGKVKQGGIDVDRRVISTYTVAGDTTVGAEKAWKLTRESSTSMSGSGAMQGQAMTLEGTSTGKGTILITQKGVFAGGEGTEDANIKIVLAANGMEVGITQASTTKIAKVK
jgi:hypothetical protein